MDVVRRVGVEVPKPCIEDAEVLLDRLAKEGTVIAALYASCASRGHRR
ncbi:hypothetical protein [Vulcanisaeta sp. JCM 16159]|nr:hypothetical protein [Vulcanisaeta sp. JCM 16159]